MLRRLPFLLVALSLSAHAGPWRYSLKPGTVTKFHYRGVDDVAVSMPMMPAVSQHLVVDTDYAVKVLKALPDGRADVEVKLEKVVLTDGAGKPTTLGKLPPDMAVLRAYLSPRGHFEFYRKVIVQVVDGNHYALGRVDANTGSASASATMDGEQVTAMASIDPKTGRVSASITRKAVAPTTHEEERQEPAQVDVLPAQVLSLMELPEGPVTPGEQFTIDLPSLRFVGEGLPPEACGKARCGKLSMKSVVDGSAEASVKTAGAMGAPPADQAAMQQDLKDADQDMAAGMADMQAQMGGMPGMGAMMGGAGGMGMGGGMPKMAMSMDAVMLFDEARGALMKVTGQVEQTTSTGGLKMASKSVFSLQAK